MNLEQWKEAAQRNLQHLAGRISQLAPGTVYGALCSASLLPVVTAAQQGDFAALMALGSVVGGVGSNLIANQIQGWYERSEEDLAAEVGQRAATDVAWRDALDAVLAAVQAPQTVQAGLPEADRVWFVDALRTELERLGNLARYEALLEGSGTIIQGTGNVGAGAYGTAIGTIQGNAYFGPEPEDPAAALRIYRRVYIASCRQLPLRGVDVGASDAAGGQKRIDLDQVYVALDTEAKVEKQALARWLGGQRDALVLHKGVASIEDVGLRADPTKREEATPLPALVAAALTSRVVLLGDPGSGKSTFLNHLGLCLALHGLEPGQNWLERLPGWPAAEGDLLPISVMLRDFARSLPKRRTEAAPQHLWRFIERRLRSQNLAFAAASLHDALERGHVLVLLDGLDEIPTREQRIYVRNAVEAFAGRYPNSRMVVTCRKLSYQDPAWQLESFLAYEIAPLDEVKINQFINAWHAELGRQRVFPPETADDLARRLREAVRRPDLWRLAPNPLLLTVMALVHTHKGRLPDARALLYEDTVDILLLRWEDFKDSGEGAPALRQLLLDAGRNDTDLKQVLWELAFEAHGQSKSSNSEALADIGELRLQKALARLHPAQSSDWACAVIETMKLRAGLLLERAPEVYTFPHRTFQEYLAGAHLTGQLDFPTRAAGLVAEGAFWREVILLAVGRLVHLVGNMAHPLALVAELCPTKVEDSALAWRKVWLAGDVLLETGLNRVQDSQQGRDLLDRVQGRLAGLLQAGALAPVERAAAGASLARLGDARFRADAWHLPDEPLLGFVHVSEGAFLMGSNPRRDRWTSKERETPQHELFLPAFYMARYPVTVAQFRAFVENSGRRPYDPDSLRGLPNHPVVLVTWHEALAYCRWLTERLRAWPATPEPLAHLLRRDGWQITLPSEAQWEKAARSDDGRIFPWGDEFDPGLANSVETSIGATSAVGCFPSGASPYGCLDMSGNVWEWTRSLWGKEWDKPDFGYPYNPGDGRENLDAGNELRRVLRGGSFVNDGESNLRCAARYWNGPMYRNDVIGFRVCASP